jgi:DNA mismatch endonuclease (patch repair protein)
MDKVSKKIRSEIMRAVKSNRNKSTEWLFRSALMRNKLRGWKVNPKIQFKPDFAFTKKKIAIFIDGCFWHGCPKCIKKPVSNKRYWSEKIRRNRKRDKEANMILRKKGWKVIRIWEHDLVYNIDKHLIKLKVLV